MYFKLKEHEYRFCFKHFIGQDKLVDAEIDRFPRKQKQLPRGATVCRLEIRDGNDWCGIHHAIAYCNPTDTFSKEQGRKHALAKLFKAGFILDGNDLFTNKIFRRDVWQAFHSRSHTINLTN